MGTLLSSKLRIALFSWSIFHVIHSITFGHGKTGVLIASRCSPHLMIFMYISLLSSVLISSYNKTWNSLSSNALNNEFHVKMTFLSTWHSISANIHIPCSFAGSVTVFILLFNTEFDAIFLLKHEIGHNTTILFNQKKNNIQKTKLEFFTLKHFVFPCKSWRLDEWEIQNKTEREIYWI